MNPRRTRLPALMASLSLAIMSSVTGVALMGTPAQATEVSPAHQHVTPTWTDATNTHRQLTTSTATASKPADVVETDGDDDAPGAAHRPWVRVLWGEGCTSLAVTPYRIPKHHSIVLTTYTAKWYRTKRYLIRPGVTQVEIDNLIAGHAHRVTWQVFNHHGRPVNRPHAVYATCPTPFDVAEFGNGCKRVDLEAGHWPENYTMHMRWYNAEGTLTGFTTVPANRWGKYDYPEGVAARFTWQVFTDDGRPVHRLRTTLCWKAAGQAQAEEHSDAMVDVTQNGVIAGPEQG